MKKVNIGGKSKICVKWQVLPIDYSHEEENNLKAKVANKYGIPKECVTIDPIFISKNEKGESVVLTNEVSDNIQNPEYQQQLFPKWLNEKGITDYDFEKIIEIDNQINNSINYEVYNNTRKYTIKWIKWDNFMSYGPNNYFDFTSLNGLVLLTSEPANQGGKSTFCLDLLRFLLFGKVTSRENDWVLQKAFNRHLKEATEMCVEGCISFDGIDYVIKRTLTRPQLSKRTAKSKVTQKVNYYKLVNDEYIELEDEENNNESSTTSTNKAIKEAIGNEQDFDLMICVSSDNLKELISLKDTDRGRLISRWIGLLPLEEKDKIARDTYNKTVLPNLLLNKYNKEDINNKITELKENNISSADEVKKIDKNIKDCNKKIQDFQKKRDSLLLSKTNIDDSLSKIDVVTLETKIQDLIERGKSKKSEKAFNDAELAKIGKIEFNENDYNELIMKDKDYNIKLANTRNDVKTISTEIEALKKGEFCPTCGAKLKNVDNSAKIEEKTKRYNELVVIGKDLCKKIETITKEIEEKKILRENFNTKNRLELLIAKNEVDIENLRHAYLEATQLKKSIEQNKAAIENNNRIEIDLNNISINISTEEQYRNSLQQNSETLKANIKINEKTITDYERIFSTIEKEEKLVRDWKIYLEMIGKNGISKMVIRSVLPLINGELMHLLSDVCDFNVEVAIDEHNDVEFYLIHDGVKSNLGSGSGFEKTVASLALRSVLSRISTFSKPSFIVFDEILGGVADENYDAVRKLYEKIVRDFSCILQITHLKQIADWHTSTIIVKKENNISTIHTA